MAGALIDIIHVIVCNSPGSWANTLGWLASMPTEKIMVNKEEIHTINKRKKLCTHWTCGRVSRACRRIRRRGGT
jgi:hypothetical protein